MSWKAEYIILIIISTLIDYVAGIQIHKSNTLIRKRIFLLMSLVTNLGLLFKFKYFNFFSDSFRAILTSFSIPMQPITLKLLLPVGISFYTFQTLSYTIDVYKNKIKPEKHLGIFAVYVSFFPQLVAGPIERARNLLPQFFKEQYFDYKRVTDGLKLMLWGFFKKIVIADRLSIIVNMVYNNPSEYTGIPLILATIFFAFQIYCDFSGYSDIAIGSAQLMGISIMENFKRPYHSKSVAEFWRKWHISLSSWFQDYVFNPMYFAISKIKNLKNLDHKKKHWISFISSMILGEALLGLWHGANWTFVVFGVYYGILIIMYYFTRKWWDKMPSVLQILFTFILVNFGWVFFRANTISDAIYILVNMFRNLSLNIDGINIGVGLIGLIINLGFIGFMEFIHLIQSRRNIRQFLDDKPLIVRWSIYMILLWLILFFGVFTEQQFIYFQF